ncbi:hypothetical protein ACFCXS_06410 [Streptomyces sp. NPDC056373]|uniref:hypothetical protein n=1 Tax=Streptomyces sp. NPDC056373 TaxID=3345798 RepID=UPI0035D87893
MGSEEQVCPSCGQPVDTVVRRHKTLGTWVPRWVAGPCHNPECASYDTEAAESGPEVKGTRPGEGPAAPEETVPPTPTPGSEAASRPVGTAPYPREAAPGRSGATPDGTGTAPGTSGAKNS